MTGFGRGDAPIGSRRLVAELRSVNHRFLELKIRLGREDAELEGELTKLVRGRLERGAVSLSLREELDDTVERTQAVSADALLDIVRAREWASALARLGDAIGSAETPSLALVCAQAGVVRQRQPEIARAEFHVAARAAVGAALDALLAERAREGEVLVRELAERLSVLGALRDAVARLAVAEPATQADKLSSRLAALLDGRNASGTPKVSIDPQRLAQEVALLAERIDVTEELVRLGAHLDEAHRLLGNKGPSGRRLDFLSQEIHREVNTVGSKSQASEITARIIDMKAELERFREQVQNVE